MSSSIVKYSFERFFLVKTFCLKKKFPNQLQMIQKVKKKRSPVKFGPPDRPVGKTGDRFFFTFWIIWSYKNWKKTVAGQIRSAGRSGRQTDRQNRRPFFTFWIISSRFWKRIFQFQNHDLTLYSFQNHDLTLYRGKKTGFAGRIQPKCWRLLLLL